jgi:hypothetical protein
MIPRARGAAVFLVTLWSARQFEGMHHQYDEYARETVPEITEPVENKRCR